MACVSMFVKLSDPAYQAQPVAERLQSIIFAFFRVFDSNGDGVIELFEVNEILSDFVSGVAAIFSSLVDHFQPYLLKVLLPVPTLRHKPDLEPRVNSLLLPSLLRLRVLNRGPGHLRACRSRSTPLSASTRKY